MTGVEAVAPLCDICKVGRAPFLRYGSLENIGRMCSACLHRTPLCAICQLPSDTPLIALPTVDQGTGPGRTSYACAACVGQEVAGLGGGHS